jgi:hypothetical protein
VKYANGINYFEAGGTRFGNVVRNVEGAPLGQFFGYEVAGLWQSQEEIDEANALDGDESTGFQDGAEPGFFRFVDRNNDGSITPDDRGQIGNPNPKFTYGLNFTLGYKNFDLTAFFYGTQGNDIFNYNRWWTDFWPSFQGQKSDDLLNKSWTPERTNTDVPKASGKSNFSTNTSSTSYYIENGSFLRMKNIQLGYKLPQGVLDRVGLTNARVYVQGINLFTATKYSGLDPELGGSDLARGIDAGNYPASRQLLVGLNLGF